MPQKLTMANITKKPSLLITSAEIKKLQEVSKSKILPHCEEIRAKVLLNYHEVQSISDIKRKTGVSRESIYKYIGKALKKD